MSPALPEPISSIIENEAERHSLAGLRTAAAMLSVAYRERGNLPQSMTPEMRAAYLAVRFPSTFAAAGPVWDDMLEALGPECPSTILDAGAGPGTASLALATRVDGIRATLVERDAGWRNLAMQLAAACGMEADFLSQPIEMPAPAGQFDIVCASYALNELPARQAESAVLNLWSRARLALVVIEPGTPQGFEAVQRVRTALIEAGGHAASPCTHDATCPMSVSDWCHRPVRVDRSALHRTLKGASLGYEDEKFCHLVMTRGLPVRSGSARIVRRPIAAKGHVHLDVCTQSGLVRETVSRREGPRFKAARGAAWGDAWDPAPGGDPSGPQE